MSHDWMIEALAELKAYADRHDLPATSAELHQMIQLVQLELAQRDTMPVRQHAIRRK